jgi:hypothetical protein
VTGDTKPGDALADKVRDEFDRNRKERERSIERLKIRAEMRSEHGEEEDTGVIHLRAEERLAARADSDPPKAAKGVVAVLNAVKTPVQAIVALAIIVAIVVLILHGWKP